MASAMSSSTTIVNLPEVLLIDILCRLPPNLIHQCKSVCKSWFALISSSNFSRTFQSHPIRSLSHPSSIALYCHNIALKFFPRILRHPNALELKISDSSLSFLNPYSEASGNQTLTFVLAFCKDLVLCTLSWVDPVFYVFNPITKQSVELPRAPQGMINGVNFGLIYNDDQMCPPRFKVVHLPTEDNKRRESSKHKVVMFASETGQWKEIVIPQRPNLDWGIDPSALAHNGKLYWVPWDRNGLIEYDPFNNECVMNSIDTDIVHPGHKIFGVSGGRLRMLGKSDGTLLKVWELKEGSEESSGSRVWDLKYEGLVKDFAVKNKSRFFHEVLKTDDNPWMQLFGFDPYDGDIVYLAMGDRDVVCATLWKKQ